MKGVKKGSAQAAGFAARQQAAIDKRIQFERSLAQICVLDMVTVALGRMGFGEKRFKQFDELLSQAFQDYDSMLKADYVDDPDVVYTFGKLDQEIKQYVGNLFVPWTERFDTTRHSWGLRIKNYDKEKNNG